MITTDPFLNLVGEFVPELIAVLSDGFKGICPFHDEKTPSFYIHTDIGFYHCFGCGAHGGPDDFAREIKRRGRNDDS